MDAIESNIRTQDADFQENLKHMKSLTAELADSLNSVRERGDTDAAELHRGRGKMLVRDRVQALLDPGTPFLELSPLAAWNMYEGEDPGGGIVTGLGSIHGKQVVVVANDATVKGGTYFPMTVKKHLRAQRVAQENRLPCIYLVDSGGAKKNGIEKVKDKMGGRGVLLDMARHLDIEALDEGIAITNDDLDGCAEAQGVEIRRGDFVLVRTGIPQMTSTAVKQYYSPFFWWKMQAVLIGVIWTLTVRRRISMRTEAELGPVWPKMVAVVSIALWTSVTVGARVIGLMG